MTKLLPLFKKLKSNKTKVGYGPDLIRQGKGVSNRNHFLPGIYAGFDPPKPRFRGRTNCSDMEQILDRAVVAVVNNGTGRDDVTWKPHRYHPDSETASIAACLNPSEMMTLQPV